MRPNGLPYPINQRGIPDDAVAGHDRAVVGHLSQHELQLCGFALLSPVLSSRQCVSPSNNLRHRETMVFFSHSAVASGKGANSLSVDSVYIRFCCQVIKQMDRLMLSWASTTSSVPCVPCCLFRHCGLPTGVITDIVSAVATVLRSKSQKHCHHASKKMMPLTDRTTQQLQCGSSHLMKST